MSATTAPLDPRQFRTTMGLFATGVAVVVAQTGGEEIAMTVNAVCSVSLDPLLVLFCPGKKTRLAAHIAGLTGYTINVLRRGQQALSTFFAGAWKERTPPPFRLVPSRCAMRLEGSLASIDCERHAVIDAGDHWIVIGRVVALEMGAHPHEPLLFFGGKYRALDLEQRSPAPDLANARDAPARIPAPPRQRLRRAGRAPRSRAPRRGSPDR